MRRNFFSLTIQEARKSRSEAPVWQFSPGLEPFRPAGWDRYYEDTATVPVPITHPDFTDLTTRTEKRGAIGLDLPTWFNLRDNNQRVMIVAQDPLRANKWYSDAFFRNGDYVCTDALVSSPFGLHLKSWREKKNGGGRVALLVKSLIVEGCGVYLTDCRKYFVYDKSESARYSAKRGKTEIYRSILQKETALIDPKCIVALGNQAYTYCNYLLGNDARLIHMPHFSGLATNSQKNFFKIPKEQSVSVEELAEKYAEYIVGRCK